MDKKDKDKSLSLVPDHQIFHFAPKREHFANS